ncbi:MAG TPA: Crp/Fnr family transcriptional regulator [Xanthobacteraceae bacterium]
MIDNVETTVGFDRSIERQAAVSTALVSVFRGKFCDLILPNRKSIIYKKHQVIYEVGDKRRTFFFLQSGFAKVGTITANGREVIYDVRKGGDVVGELCAAEQARLDRAVALEETETVPVPLEDIIELLSIKPRVLPMFIDVFCQALKEAYEQVNTLAIDDMVQRLKKVLFALATKLGQKTGSLVEIPTYLTQEEIAQMVGARRERISTALNSLRRQGMVHYSTRGHLVLDMAAFEPFSIDDAATHHF